ncbi:hypothetical protein AL1T_16640 [Acinetobacter lwoffii]|nr:hypothetical protein AL1T_16640 [Acinetobacter lwoffii]
MNNIVQIRHKIPVSLKTCPYLSIGLIVTKAAQISVEFFVFSYVFSITIGHKLLSHQRIKIF